MPGITRIEQDTAGGKLVGILAPTVFVNGTNITVIGDSIQPHPPSPPHNTNPVMEEGSSTVFAHGIGVCREGDKANCGHPATGSDNVFAGD